MCVQQGQEWGGAGAWLALRTSALSGQNAAVQAAVHLLALLLPFLVGWLVANHSIASPLVSGTLS